MLDAARGMLTLHSHRPSIVHCNLNSPNLLVTKNWGVKVRSKGRSQGSWEILLQGSASSQYITCVPVPAGGRAAFPFKQWAGFLCLESSPPCLPRRLQVGDFTLAKVMDGNSSAALEVQTLNPRWLAPEVLGGAPASTCSVRAHVVWGPGVPMIRIASAVFHCCPRQHMGCMFAGRLAGPMSSNPALYLLSGCCCCCCLAAVTCRTSLLLGSSCGKS
jgi:hypothetical protein